MTSVTPDPQSPDAEVPAVEPGAIAAAPAQVSAPAAQDAAAAPRKRKPRTPKVTEEGADAAAAPEAASAAEESVAPVRKRKPRVAKAALAEAEVEAPVAADPAPADAPAVAQPDAAEPVAVVVADAEPAAAQPQPAVAGTRGSRGARVEERVEIADSDDLDEADDEEEDEDEEDEFDREQRAAERAARSAASAEPIQFSDVVSGQFDEDEAGAEEDTTKRVLLPQADAPKLHKVLAQAGMGSRLEMERLILEGRISVNNEPAHIGQRIQFGDQIKFNGKPIRYRIAPPPPRVIAYHKPVGEVVTHDDPQNRPTVFRKLPRLYQGKWQSVGRLDLNTEGLLLFSSSGELANRLMHPRFGLEREYAVRVLGALNKEEKERLLDGVQLADGRAQFGSIEDGGGEGSNHWYRVTISEGRNREVRRMLEAVGHAVSRLIRIRYGAMLLPRGLKRGAWMELDERDIRALTQAAGIDQPAAPRQNEGPGRNKKPRRGDGRSQRGGPRPAEGGGLPRGGRAGDAGAARNGAKKGRGSGGRNPSGGGNGGPGGAGGNNQPDPMKTSLGYIGADSFLRQRKDGPPRRSGGGGGFSGPSGGGGGQGAGGRGGNRRGRPR